MFEKLEKDTEKVINDSKSGTRFFGSYSNEYRTETYTNEKGKKRNRRVYIGDDYIIDDEKYKQKLVLILVLNILALAIMFNAGVKYVEFNYLWYINVFQMTYLIVSIYYISLAVQGILLDKKLTHKDFDTTLGRMKSYIPYLVIMLIIIVVLCIFNMFTSSGFTSDNLFNVLYYLISTVLDLLIIRIVKPIKYHVQKKGKK
ncbi:MAG: hypothetical protein PUC86_06300 [Solobacterium sp.]|nr:hypothetical protein [Solobacterium sp.]MDY2731522.1 hypothetical protein [Erysipelotrichaceae bacterium]MDD5983710.1 hypothetical protein [Solobacterium sp.]MDD6122121.1 hypothetical protein [Solobacterium sp.]MDD6496893.1 hypothetical protein [Solobacterium sp.]